MCSPSILCLIICGSDNTFIYKQFMSFSIWNLLVAIDKNRSINAEPCFHSDTATM